ncbi:MAG: flippase-like domain-containing protein [Actinomycetales bacterium]|nr:flippase-like domain-containing protein [Actinomycetales bacterium]
MSEVPQEPAAGTLGTTTARDRLRAALTRRQDPDGHGVTIVDTPETRVHHPSDLLAVVLASLGIALVLLLAVYAHATTSGVEADVQGLARVLQRVLFVPVAVLESLLTFVVPAAIVIELSARRLWRQVLEVLAAGALGLVLGALTLWLIRTWGSSELIGSLSVRRGSTSVVIIPSYVAAITAMLVTAGPRTRRRTVRWSWNLLWVALGTVAITGTIPLLAVVVALLLGRAAGSGVRYLAGVRSERAYGADLVRGVRQAGFAPVRLVRVHDVASRDDDEPGTLAAAALVRYADNRVYAMTTETDERLDVVVLDGDRQVVGFLTRLWRSLRLRGIDGRAVVSLRQAAERAALLAYAARAAGVRTPRLLAISEAEDSMLLVQEHVADAVPLRDLPAEEITDEVLAGIWEQLGLAHAAGIAHRALTSDVVLLDSERDDAAVWLTGWEYGDVASSDLARRIDMTQLVAMLALRVGAGRALSSAVEVLPSEDIAAIGPLLQTVTLPRSTRDELRSHRTVLAELRAALVERLPEADVEPERLVRFGARTVITITLLLAAVVAVVTSLNLDQIRTALTTAQPVWAAVAFVLGLLTWVGAGLTLIAFTPVRIPPWRTILTQVAGSFVAIAAPAGVGPAALNLQLLRKRGVSATLAGATVALVQVSQFIVTIGILLVLGIVSGDGGALRSLPSATVLWALGIVAALVAALLLIPPVRHWVAQRTLPLVRQTWPRLIEVLGQPSRLVLALGGNVLMTMGYVLAFDASLAAFGVELSLLDVAVIYLIANATGAAVPTPGGLGAVELALIAGLSGAGVPPAIATSVTVLFRVLTYWARIPIGWLAMRHLQKVGDL